MRNCLKIWRARRDLNPQPSDPKLAPALNDPKLEGKEVRIFNVFRHACADKTSHFSFICT